MKYIILKTRNLKETHKKATKKTLPTRLYDSTGLKEPNKEKQDNESNKRCNDISTLFPLWDLSFNVFFIILVY